MSLLLLMAAAAQFPKSHLDDIHEQHICRLLLEHQSGLQSPGYAGVKLHPRLAGIAAWINVPGSLPVSEIGMSVCGN